MICNMPQRSEFSLRVISGSVNLSFFLVTHNGQTVGKYILLTICFYYDIRSWSGREDSNLRPPAPKAGALPDCATPRLLYYNMLAKLLSRYPALMCSRVTPGVTSDKVRNADT